MDSVLHRIPVVAGLAYIERVRRLPSAFIAALVPEPENRCFQNAVAVLVDGDKIGYLAPELCRGYFAPLVARGSAGPVTCPGRRASQTDHDTSGVELLLDFSHLPVEAEA